MKELKLFVPESFVGVIDGYPVDITRKEIHLLVRDKAVDLGYMEPILEDNYCYFYFMESGGVTSTSIESNFKSWPAEEIPWQDFLKLTPGDVNDSYPIEKASKSFDALLNEKPQIFNRADFGEKVNTERNELAKELLKVIVANETPRSPTSIPRDILGNKEKTIKYTNEAYKITDTKYIKRSLFLATEFMKQAGEK